MKNKQEKDRVCTSTWHTSTSFNKTYGHPSWQQLKNTMVTKLMPSISWELLTKNQDVLVLIKNLADIASMIDLQIEEKLNPNMPI